MSLVAELSTIIFRHRASPIFTARQKSRTWGQHRRLSWGCLKHHSRRLNNPIYMLGLGKIIKNVYLSASKFRFSKGCYIGLDKQTRLLYRLDTRLNTPDH